MKKATITFDHIERELIISRGVIPYDQILEATINDSIDRKNHPPTLTLKILLGDVYHVRDDVITPTGKPS